MNFQYIACIGYCGVFVYKGLRARWEACFGGRGARLWRHPGSIDLLVSSINVTYFKALCAGGGNVTFGLP